MGGPYKGSNEDLVSTKEEFFSRAKKGSQTLTRAK
jgi:hypothetical protein